MVRSSAFWAFLAVLTTEALWSVAGRRYASLEEVTRSQLALEPVEAQIFDFASPSSSVMSKIAGMKSQEYKELWPINCRGDSALGVSKFVSSMKGLAGMNGFRCLLSEGGQAATPVHPGWRNSSLSGSICCNTVGGVVIEEPQCVEARYSDCTHLTLADAAGAVAMSVNEISLEDSAADSEDDDVEDEDYVDPNPVDTSDELQDEDYADPDPVDASDELQDYLDDEVVDDEEAEEGGSPDESNGPQGSASSAEALTGRQARQQARLALPRGHSSFSFGSISELPVWPPPGLKKAPNAQLVEDKGKLAEIKAMWLRREQAKSADEVRENSEARLRTLQTQLTEARRAYLEAASAKSAQEVKTKAFLRSAETQGKLQEARSSVEKAEHAKTWQGVFGEVKGRVAELEAIQRAAYEKAQQAKVTKGEYKNESYSVKQITQELTAKDEAQTRGQLHEAKMVLLRAHAAHVAQTTSTAAEAVMHFESARVTTLQAQVIEIRATMDLVVADAWPETLQLLSARVQDLEAVAVEASRLDESASSNERQAEVDGQLEVARQVLLYAQAASGSDDDRSAKDVVQDYIVLREQQLEAQVVEAVVPLEAEGVEGWAEMFDVAQQRVERLEEAVSEAHRDELQAAEYREDDSASASIAVAVAQGRLQEAKMFLLQTEAAHVSATAQTPREALRSLNNFRFVQLLAQASEAEAATQTAEAAMTTFQVQERALERIATLEGQTSQAEDAAELAAEITDDEFEEQVDVQQNAVGSDIADLENKVREQEELLASASEDTKVEDAQKSAHRAKLQGKLKAAQTVARVAELLPAEDVQSKTDERLAEIEGRVAEAVRAAEEAAQQKLELASQRMAELEAKLAAHEQQPSEQTTEEQSEAERKIAELEGKLAEAQRSAQTAESKQMQSAADRIAELEVKLAEMESTTQDNLKLHDPMEIYKLRGSIREVRDLADKEAEVKDTAADKRIKELERQLAEAAVRAETKTAAEGEKAAEALAQLQGKLAEAENAQEVAVKMRVADLQRQLGMKLAKAEARAAEATAAERERHAGDIATLNTKLKEARRVGAKRANQKSEKAAVNIQTLKGKLNNAELAAEDDKKTDEERMELRAKVAMLEAQLAEAQTVAESVAATRVADLEQQIQDKVALAANAAEEQQKTRAAEAIASLETKLAQAKTSHQQASQDKNDRITELEEKLRAAEAHASSDDADQDSGRADEKVAALERQLAEAKLAADSAREKQASLASAISETVATHVAELEGQLIEAQMAAEQARTITESSQADDAIRIAELEAELLDAEVSAAEAEAQAAVAAIEAQVAQAEAAAGEEAKEEAEIAEAEAEARAAAAEAEAAAVRSKNGGSGSQVPEATRQLSHRAITQRGPESRGSRDVAADNKESMRTATRNMDSNDDNKETPVQSPQGSHKRRSRGGKGRRSSGQHNSRVRKEPEEEENEQAPQKVTVRHEEVTADDKKKGVLQNMALHIPQKAVAFKEKQAMLTALGRRNLKRILRKMTGLLSMLSTAHTGAKLFVCAHGSTTSCLDVADRPNGQKKCYKAGFRLKKLPGLRAKKIATRLEKQIPSLEFGKPTGHFKYEDGKNGGFIGGRYATVIIKAYDPSFHQPTCSREELYRFVNSASASRKNHAVRHARNHRAHKGKGRAGKGRAHVKKTQRNVKATKTASPPVPRPVSPPVPSPKPRPEATGRGGGRKKSGRGARKSGGRSGKGRRSGSGSGKKSGRGSENSVNAGAKKKRRFR